MNLGISANSFLAYLSSSLSQAGSETTIYLSGLTTLTGETIETDNFSQFGIGRITIDPLSTTEIEFCSFTAVDATDVALTGAVRGLSAVGSDSATSRMPYHPVGTPVIISFGVHNINDLKKYIDDAIATVTAGTANVVSGLAGENVAAGNLVYLKSDGKWWKTDANTVATIDNVQMGIAQGTGSTNGTITNGVLIQGLDTHQSGGSAGGYGYVSNTAGQISTSAGTTSLIIGQFKTATNFYFNFGFKIVPSTEQKDALAGTGTPSSSNKYVTADTLASYAQLSFGDGSDGDVTISSPTTLTRDMYYNTLVVNDTLTTGNYRIFVKGQISGSGTIKQDGNNGSSGSSSNAGAGGAGGTSIIGYFTSLAGGAGGTGGSTAGTAGAASTHSINTTAGADGDGGGGGHGEAGGGGGVSSIQSKFGIFAPNTILGIDFGITIGVYNPSPAAGGGGGGYDNSGTGGGGGGGGGTAGGIVFIMAQTWTGTFTISVKGGNGGSGGSNVHGNGGTGGGGAGGVSIVIYKTKTWTGSYVLTAGTGAGTIATGLSKEIDINTLIR